MKLTGILEQAFHGQIIYRGFAPLRNLALLSQSDNYQRTADVQRLDEIKNFFSSSPFLFFPELIFGWRLRGEETLRLIKEQQTGTINASDGVKFRKAKFVLPEANYAIGDIPTKKDLSIEIPDEVVATKPFTRIDGNHRLSVIDGLIIEEESTGIKNEIGNALVPYSILLQFDNPEEAKKYESAYFYLVNSRSTPLTTEQNLHSILESNDFSDLELNDLFQFNDPQVIRRVRDVLNFLRSNVEVLDIIDDLFNNEIYSLSKDIATNFENDIAEIKRALITINLDYKNRKIKIKSKNVCKAALEILLCHSKEYDRFIRWINDNNLGDVDNILGKDFVRLYLKTHVKSIIKVFVAMPYVSFKRVNDYNKLFREVLEDEIPKKVNAAIELIPIMRFKGSSQRIDQRLLKSIEECHIFIADITGLNENVIFEIGVAQGLKRPTILIKANPDSDIRGIFDEAGLDVNKGIPFDMDKMQYIPYSLTGYYNDIKTIIKNNVPEILNKEYGIEIIK